MPDLSAAEFTLLQGAHLFAPEDQGICDVLLANGKIIAVGADIPGDIVPDCAVINLSGRMLCGLYRPTRSSDRRRRRSGADDADAGSLSEPPDGSQDNNGRRPAWHRLRQPPSRVAVSQNASAK